MIVALCSLGAASAVPLHNHSRLKTAGRSPICPLSAVTCCSIPCPEQRRQRHTIEQALFPHNAMPVYGEYIDNLSGRYADNRPAYQRMLADARAGRFSHVAAENAERFGRNDIDALTAIDELYELGVMVCFADYPDLDPVGPDDRIMVSLSFTLARHESIKLSQRTIGGMHASLLSGRFMGMPPDGYINREHRTDKTDKSEHGHYERWIEQDPERIHIWREAWDLLLTDEICEELHSRGYHYRSGRPFVTVKTNGKRVANKSTLDHIFHNWFYAGWLVSEKAGIPPKSTQGNWKPLITTDELERGIAILHRRTRNRSYRRKNDYLLQGMVYVQLPDREQPVKLTASTSNTRRPGGGTAYYCLASSRINIRCRTVGEQIPQELAKVQVDPEVIPDIRAAYTQEVAERLGHTGTDERDRIKKALKEIDSEEERAARLYASGKITDAVWDKLWTESQDRRRTLHADLEALDR